MQNEEYAFCPLEILRLSLFNILNHKLLFQFIRAQPDLKNSTMSVDIVDIKHGPRLGKGVTHCCRVPTPVAL